jgi:hypothetical protein
MSKAPTETTWEYPTYVARSPECVICNNPIKPLQPARRGFKGNPPNPPVIVYRHTDPLQCKKTGEDNGK